ncbi:MAG TPA: hypothetical protein RMH85_13940 [Polyangiaceae bacterium LLY-WYZ-15_(1-7)]|nr:hypothetical protein [Myxococcales bacterium]MAT26262.1 hypothetical protein [Sandaracinus sp.]HJK91788.1 hypothetical protein [Polyangiaceae bacterium LLY-WYZ-15_(1-7)]MBJ73963.1 hypothetical protein [Sandaracinus sp.]HJL03485.1 hypothetical protein [Polyangiaceae bacterium LLY-WYZ-15_(1-7)]
MRGLGWLFLVGALALGCGDDDGAETGDGGVDGGSVMCVAPSSIDDRVACSEETPCCEGYDCTGGTCTGCPSADAPCIEGPGAGFDGGF